MPLSCLDKICQGIASCGERGSHGGHSAFAGGRCPTCIPSKGQAMLGEESGAGQTQRRGWKHHRVLCRATGEPGIVQSLCHAHDLAMRVPFNKNVRKEKKERKKRTNPRSQQPELPPRGWSQVFLCWRKGPASATSRWSPGARQRAGTPSSPSGVATVPHRAPVPCHWAGVRPGPGGGELVRRGSMDMAAPCMLCSL